MDDTPDLAHSAAHTLRGINAASLVFMSASACPMPCARWANRWGESPRIWSERPRRVRLSTLPLPASAGAHFLV